MAQQPVTIKELFEAMPQYVNPSATQGVDKTIQFNITEDGVEKEYYHLVVRDGTATTMEGVTPNPDATIITPADVWMQVSTGQTNGAVAFMTGKFKATGDLTTLMAMQSWFNMPG